MVLVRSFIWYVQLKLNGKKRVLIVASTMEHGKRMSEKVFEHVKGWFEIRAVVTADKKERSQNISHISMSY